VSSLPSFWKYCARGSVSSRAFMPTFAHIATMAVQIFSSLM
jgi:hypothetical protein